jgi:hypothetical protein
MTLLDLGNRLKSLFGQTGNAVQQWANAPRPVTSQNFKPVFSPQQVQQGVKTVQNFGNRVQQQARPAVVNFGRTLQKTPMLTQSLTNFENQSWQKFSPSINNYRMKLQQASPINYGLKGMALDFPSQMAGSAGRLLERGANKQLFRGGAGQKATDVMDIAMFTPMGRLGKPAQAFSKEQLAMAKAFRPQTKQILGRFAELVESGKGRNQMGLVGEYVDTLARTIFGDGARTLNNRQLKNAFDALQETAAGRNIKPSWGVGLSVKDIRGGKKTVAQPTIGGVKTLKSQILTEQPPRAKMSIKAISEGIESPRTGRDISVSPQAVQRFKALGNKEELNQLIQETGGQPLLGSRGRANQLLNQKQRQTLGGQQIKGAGQYQESTKSYDRIIDDFDDFVKKEAPELKSKVNVIDSLFRTPDRVLNKIGLKKEADFIRKSYDKYQKEMPVEINKITVWSKRVPQNENQALFKYLDGQTNLKSLSPGAQKVAGEIKTYLAEWADKLGLPKDGRITNYITHIFEKDFIQKEFDPDIARIINEKVAGSVYDPFVQQRLGKMGYVEDTWRALDAYVKRATRKVNMDPALKVVKDASNKLEQSQYEYVKNYIDRVNMRPTKWDTLIDNTIKQVAGYKFGQRPMTVLSQKARQWVYRATLGLNPGTALKNLTQGANTYAKLGEKYTIVGYKDLLAKGTKELEEVGVLKNDIIQDRTINATRKFWEKFDRGLFVFFETAEKINRGSAYYGAKAKALAQGKSEQEAIKYGKKIVRDTQFVFGSIDTPPILQSDIGKTVGQFQSFTIKQGEFLGEMIKNKDIAGMLRWGGASLAMVFTIGKAIGMEPKDLIPTLRIGVPPTMQIPYEIGKTALGVPDKYGNKPTWGKTIKKNWPLTMPGGVQLKKTIEGLGATSKGYSETDSGLVRYPVGQDAVSKIRGGLFGQYNLPGAREYFDNKKRPLSEKQTESFKQAKDPVKYYSEIMANRTANKEAKEKGISLNEATNVRERVKQSGKTEKHNGVVYYRENGSVKSLKTQRPMVAPKLTGQASLDKKLLASYRAKISARQTEVSKLYQVGDISVEQAQKEIDRLEGMKYTINGKKVGTGLKAKKAKKITIKSPSVKSSVTFTKSKRTAMPKLSIPATPKFKASKPKTIKISVGSYKVPAIKVKPFKNTLMG